MILGTLLGDGSMRLGTAFPSYRVNHSSKQADYCQSKLDLLLDYSSMREVQIAPNDGYGAFVARFWTLSTPIFGFVGRLCYAKDAARSCGARKYVTQEWVNQLNWRQVAWWYQDDGGKQARSMCFATHAFSREEVGRLTDWLTANGVEARPHKIEKGEKEYWQARCSTEGSVVLADRIREFMHPSMLYKIPHFLEKESVCLECGAPTRKESTMGPVVKICSDACRNAREERRSQQKYANRTAEQRAATNARARAAWAAMPEEERQAVSRYNNAFRYSSDERRAEHNENKKVWRKRRKKAGIKERPTQQHTCQFCRATFENSATHKMGARSPAIYCPAPACLKAGEEAYKEIRRRTAREKWAKDRSATSSP